MKAKLKHIAVPKPLPNVVIMMTWEEAQALIRYSRGFSHATVLTTLHNALIFAGVRE